MLNAHADWCFQGKGFQKGNFFSRICCLLWEWESNLNLEYHLVITQTFASQIDSLLLLCFLWDCCCYCRLNVLCCPVAEAVCVCVFSLGQGSYLSLCLSDDIFGLMQSGAALLRTMSFSLMWNLIGYFGLGLLMSNCMLGYLWSMKLNQ